MEIRTITAQERMKVAALLDGWRLAEGWSAGDRFRQQAEWDPTWHDENVFVALEKDRIVATATVVPRHLKILGHVVPTGGIGNPEATTRSSLLRPRRAGRPLQSPSMT